MVGIVGEMKLVYEDRIPDGYLVADGSSLETAVYPELYAVYGTAFGSEGPGYFNLPDLRGYFIRCHTFDSSVDPEKTSRTDRGDGTAGNVVGTKQADALGRHRHSTRTSATGGRSDDSVFNQWQNPVRTNYAGDAAEDEYNIGSDTRPVNHAYRAVICYE